jgi:hypothetical protein
LIPPYIDAKSSISSLIKFLACADKSKWYLTGLSQTTVMAAHKPIFAIVVMFLSISTIWCAIPSPDNFDRAREEIKKRSEIKYDTTFCVEVAKGDDKIACRLKDVPSIGFLVCKTLSYEENSYSYPCKDIIKTELDNLVKLRGENIKIVTVDIHPIENVKCGETEDETCSGFLERWIDTADGEFGHVRDHIAKNTVTELIQNVVQFTSKEGLQTTIDDLNKIVKFMQPSSPDNYKQICDLQGFFLKIGGFLINDTPEINENIAKDGVCWPDEPTTEQVLQGLNNIINGLTKDQK